MTSYNVAARLSQANLASKNHIANSVKKEDFNDKLKNLNELSVKVDLIFNKFDNVDSKEASFKGNVYNFLLVIVLLIWHFKHSQIFNDQK